MYKYEQSLLDKALDIIHLTTQLVLSLDCSYCLYNWFKICMSPVLFVYIFLIVFSKLINRKINQANLKLSVITLVFN